MLPSKTIDAQDADFKVMTPQGYTYSIVKTTGKIKSSTTFHSLQVTESSECLGSDTRQNLSANIGIITNRYDATPYEYVARYYIPHDTVPLYTSSSGPKLYQDQNPMFFSCSEMTYDKLYEYQLNDPVITGVPNDEYLPTPIRVMRY